MGRLALLGIGGALIYALQTRDAEPGGDELYSIENRPTVDGLSGLPRDYTGPLLGPPLPGDLGGPILDAQNRGQPVAPLEPRRVWLVLDLPISILEASLWFRTGTSHS